MEGIVTVRATMSSKINADMSNHSIIYIHMAYQ